MALARVEPDASALAMVMDPSAAEAQLHALQDFVRRVMVEGEDFGVIPGTEKSGGKDAQGNQRPPKKTLLQPGAQKLAEIYGFAVTFTDERPPVERWEMEDPLFAYVKRATITRRRDGLYLGSGIGSCNSRETRYAGRWVFEREVPAELDRDRLPRRDGTAKGSGKPYVMYRVPNPALYDLVNTIEKMACKRAYVGAVIGVTRSAGIFTQDAEDIPPEAYGERRPVAASREHEHTGHGANIPDAEIEEPYAEPPPPARPEWAESIRAAAFVKGWRTADLAAAAVRVATSGVAPVEAVEAELVEAMAWAKVPEAHKPKALEFFRGETAKAMPPPAEQGAPRAGAAS
jgi:hypothetical protein